jgi:hypothetical protein
MAAALLLMTIGIPKIKILKIPSVVKISLLELLLLPWKENRLFRGLKHGKDVISVNYPRKDFHGTFIARTNIISVEYYGDNPFPRN